MVNFSHRRRLDSLVGSNLRDGSRQVSVGIRVGGYRPLGKLVAELAVDEGGFWNACVMQNGEIRRVCRCIDAGFLSLENLFVDLLHDRAVQSQRSDRSRLLRSDRFAGWHSTGLRVWVSQEVLHEEID